MNVVNAVRLGATLASKGAQIRTRQDLETTNGAAGLVCVQARFEPKMSDCNRFLTDSSSLPLPVQHNVQGEPACLSNNALHCTTQPVAFQS